MKKDKRKTLRVNWFKAWKDEPEDDQEVILVISDPNDHAKERLVLGWYEKSGPSFYIRGARELDCISKVAPRVTHWIPAPEKPSKKKK